MKKLLAALCLAALVAATGTPAAGLGAEWVNADTGELEFLGGEAHFSSLYSRAGIVVGPGCTLIVDGDVDAGGRFVARGGSVVIGGELRALAVWLDSSQGGLDARIGSVSAEYFTHCGGAVSVAGDISTRAREGVDSYGLVNINGERSAYGAAKLEVGGRVRSTGGDIVVGNPLPADEAAGAAFAQVRGGEDVGYADAGIPAGEPEFYAEGGLVAAGGGKVMGVS
ncbi:MAG: hypothetical protein LBN99_00010 [Oscillospiraceae bacterium]|jgi:hypothetical protein|nr:hypothetical protein [Oscillospiraceae bacterium]